MLKVIAVDFDGCLCKNAFPDIGSPNLDVICELKKEIAKGTKTILWTCRHGKLLDEAVEACRSWGIEFDSINESIPEWLAQWDSDPRKVGATEYWDDRAYNPINVGFWVDDYKCSECSWEHLDANNNPIKTTFKFCPNCGRKMIF